MMERFLGVIGILATTLLVYTYFGYPLLLHLLTLLLGQKKGVTKSEFQTLPSVTMIIPVHNEEEVIRGKLENVSTLRYGGPFNFIVVSDSTDATDKIVEEESGEMTRLISLNERRGKSYAINQAVIQATGEILVFSDANTLYQPRAVEKLVHPLADDGVGCSTGNLRLVDSSGKTIETTYWRYELWLRRLESKLGTTVSVNGGLLSMRRSDFQPLPESTLTDDSVLALRELSKGNSIAFVEDAVGTETTAGSLDREFSRRIRIGAGNYQTLTRFVHLLNPKYGVSALQFFSHKVLRWLAPFLLVVLFLASGAHATATEAVASSVLFVSQVIFYLLAAVGISIKELRSHKLFSIPAYFVWMNVALAIGCWRFLTGHTIDIWVSQGRG